MENDALLKMIESEMEGDIPPIIKLLNSLSMIKEYLGNGAWVGFYIYDEKKDFLILGPFQGSPACEKIMPGKGVVGTSLSERKDIYVEDVRGCRNYIACDSRARSEAVFYIEYGQGKKCIFDIDSNEVDGLKEHFEALKKAGDRLSRLLEGSGF